MTKANRKVLRIAARALVFVSLAIQISFIAYAWWDFDPRLSCHRLQYWREWIACLHGESHFYIRLIELFVLSWLAAGLALLLARFLPPYISVLIPGALALASFWQGIDYWNDYVASYPPFGEATWWELGTFMVTFIPVNIYLIGPMIATWLLGFDARALRRRLQMSAAT